MMTADRVTSRDLRGFSRDAIKLILWAQEQGARIKISNRGHAVVLGPDGTSTTAVARNLSPANRSSQNATANVRRLFDSNKDSNEETC